MPGRRGITAGLTANKLWNLGCAGCFFAEYFTLIIYPSEHKDWEIFDQRYPEKSPRSRLRFLLRESHDGQYEAFNRLVGSAKVENTGDGSLSFADHSSLPYNLNPRHANPQEQQPTADPRLASRRFSSSAADAQTLSRQDPTPQQIKVAPVAILSNVHSEKLSPNTATLNRILQQLRQTPALVPKAHDLYRPVNFEELSQAIMSSEPELLIKLFKEELDIDWAAMQPRLEKPGQSITEVTVFLHYPKQLDDERKVLAAFLRRLGAKRYDSASPADWRAFSENRKAGVMLVSRRRL